MKCPHCGQMETRVIDSRPAENGTLLRRRRLCDACGDRFTTYERVLQAPLIVVKKDGRREEFSPEKLRSGIVKACNKRSVTTEDIATLVTDVEALLRADPGAEVNAERIGELVMERLFHLDQVAYVRFASVYQRFDDVRRFAQLLERMSRRARHRSPAPTVQATSTGNTNGTGKRQP
ncbi:MAG: transcriptional regulator NrdR [Burkholderiaceae bacterium]